MDVIAQRTRTEPLLVSIKDAQAMIGRGRWSIYNMIANGEIEAVRAGSRSTLVKVDSLRRYVDSLPAVRTRPLRKRA